MELGNPPFLALGQGLIIDMGVTDENIIHENFILIENLLFTLPLFGWDKVSHHLLFLIRMKRKKKRFSLL